MKPETFEALLLLPRLRVQNANAVSSAMTWGFPAPSAFTGFVHALELRLNKLGKRLQFGGVGIICHQFDPQVFQPPGRRTQVFRLTRNPVNQEGNTSAIVEEGRTHLEISLLLTVSGDDCPLAEGDYEALAAQILDCAQGMRLAGGSVLPHPARSKHPAEWVGWPLLLDDRRTKWRKLRRRLMPGFVLVSREHLLAQHLDTLQQAQRGAQRDGLQPPAKPLNAMDALLDLCRLNMAPEPVQEASAPAAQAAPQTAAPASAPAPASASASASASAPVATVAAPVKWAVQRRYPGWLVPLSVGYAAVSPLFDPGTVKNARDDAQPFRFVESVLSLGEWVSPHRIAEVTDVLWHHDAQPDAGLYRIHNPYSSIIDLTPSASASTSAL